MKNGQKSSLYTETSRYSEEIPYSEPLSQIHYKEYLLYHVFSAIFVSQHQKAKYQFPFEIPCVIWKHIGCLLRTTSYYHVIMLYHRDCPKIYSTKATLVQLRTKQTTHLIDKNYQNEITLTGQNPPLKCCQPLEILTKLKKRIDL